MPADSTTGGYRADRMRALALSAIAAAAFLLPPSAFEGLPRSCPWYGLTGTDCPCCGLVRSIVAAAHGDFPLSLSLHPFGAAALAAAIIGAGFFALRWLTGRPAGTVFRRLVRWLTAAAAILWSSWWAVYRLFY